MLQCTAITNLPHDEALPALLAMDDCPDDAEDLLDDKPYVLCELGEHDETTEHAARLWTAETEPPASLWFLWTTSAGGHRVHHRLVLLALCPYRIHHLRENYRQWCGLYEANPATAASTSPTPSATPTTHTSDTTPNAQGRRRRGRRPNVLIRWAVPRPGYGVSCATIHAVSPACAGTTRGYQPSG